MTTNLKCELCHNIVDPDDYQAHMEIHHSSSHYWEARRASTGYIAILFQGNTEIYRQSLDCLEDLQRIADTHNAELQLLWFDNKAKTERSPFA